MAKLIKPNGTITDILPKNGKEFSLEELKAIVNCDTIEYVRLTDLRFFIIDEDGKGKNKPLNQLATAIYNAAPHDYIAGNALLCRVGEVT